MHGTAGGYKTGGFPAQGSGIDQFSGDADGDFFRGYGLDEGADGGMDPGDGFFDNAPLPELLVDSSGFLSGTDMTPT